MLPYLFSLATVCYRTCSLLQQHATVLPLSLQCATVSVLTTVCCREILYLYRTYHLSLQSAAVPFLSHFSVLPYLSRDSVLPYLTARATALQYTTVPLLSLDHATVPFISLHCATVSVLLNTVCYREIQ